MANGTGARKEGEVASGWWGEKGESREERRVERVAGGESGEQRVGRVERVAGREGSRVESSGRGGERGRQMSASFFIFF